MRSRSEVEKKDKGRATSIFVSLFRFFFPFSIFFSFFERKFFAPSVFALFCFSRFPLATEQSNLSLLSLSTKRTHKKKPRCAPRSRLLRWRRRRPLRRRRLLDLCVPSSPQLCPAPGAPLPRGRASRPPRPPRRDSEASEPEPHAQTTSPHPRQRRPSHRRARRRRCPLFASPGRRR